MKTARHRDGHLLLVLVFGRPAVDDVDDVAVDRLHVGGRAGREVDQSADLLSDPVGPVDRHEAARAYPAAVSEQPSDVDQKIRLVPLL